jgi:hypothetical protein
LVVIFHRPLRSQVYRQAPLASTELLCLYQHHPRHHPEASSNPLKPGRRATTPLPAMLPAKKTLHLARRMGLESRNTAALCLGSLDTGRALMGQDLECKRRRCSRKTFKSLRFQPLLGLLHHRGLTLSVRMRGLRSVQVLATRRRLLPQIGIISLGRVCIWYDHSFA